MTFPLVIVVYSRLVTRWLFLDLTILLFTLPVSPGV